MSRLRIYTASKTTHASTWRDLRTAWGEFEFTSRWIDMKIFSELEPQLCRSGWMIDEEDVERSHITMVYAQDGEFLRGALVEAGMAIAFRREVLCVGQSYNYGTWQFHPRVTRVDDLVAARAWLRNRAGLFPNA